jgi:hypothetical protein
MRYVCVCKGVKAGIGVRYGFVSWCDPEVDRAVDFQNNLT